MERGNVSALASDKLPIFVSVPSSEGSPPSPPYVTGSGNGSAAVGSSRDGLRLGVKATREEEKHICEVDAMSNEMKGLLLFQASVPVGKCSPVGCAESPCRSPQ